jgi:hypothetical protein
MRNLGRLLGIGMLLLACWLVAAVIVAAPASAQRSGARDAAMQRCIDQAQRRFPDRTAGGAGRNRVFAYKACMSKAGFAP